MKRLMLGVCMMTMVMAAAPLFAQADGNNGLDPGTTIRSPATLYPLRLTAIRVYTHAQGYRVVYRRGATGTADAYLPMSWFVAGGKASLIRLNDTSVPYLVVYYNPDRTVHHVKLYVHSSYSHSSWGFLSGDPGTRFQSDTLTLEF
ncbi:MAG: hypothetical protein A2087_08830 [Spirochaetes bacterium GWD1_61_31]|nr:MAG: hypothetical protein A2Y37_14515 [Spirochaetes bacterium GWB1_60_80]OHD32565.1 MAG: hypothetical protein A2004_06080 [Spirochaetes bacterium GWC1_61_12]OHD38072.1 MAG: hypothetical protein A2087_08830 [Spirochaetes bacterium GWD1_61_31]OHD44558.1 MAG: hypothetical protein A2Y35_05355 [Spirochaetes bacterium GWE1_60_18]OHD58654.1 MAG: hypothetical protein A2Y32_03260 [Spirochaetes bacterium GWF1_60_12]HAP43215.1 hypothetical protein [Spirochaetaceae bacterium]